ncbi:hypothetical protein KOR42_34550 [Thalassoglobus neptunius]|uniref:Uncharacterized protein n=1 Tax=Thalassoglobus neptunius TaxID=1938619 RepID=A0A5C5WMC3_9PLAN|nr:hypothetical protein KOR42_34550 [Thalassoglobus neptunius]
MTSGAGVVQRIEPVVIATSPFPAGDHSLAVHELFGLAFGREMLAQREVFMGRRLKQCHRARFVERSCQPLMDPGLPVVGVDLEQVLMRRPDPVHMEPFADVLDDRTSGGRSVVPLLPLLRCAATD